MPIEKTCIICGRMFMGTRQKQVCSRKCAKERARKYYNAHRSPPKQLRCIMCGKLFPAHYNRRKCKECAEREKRFKEKGGQVCKICGKFFFSNGKKARICDECLNQIERYEACKEKRCWNCGKVFTPYKVTVDKYGIHPAGKFFCCFKCCEEWNRRKQKERQSDL